MSFEKVVDLQHRLTTLRQVDRMGGADSFFGRMEILEQLLEEAHNSIGRQWRRMNRYGNCVSPEAFNAAIRKWKELGFTLEELEDQANFFMTHDTPDAALFRVLVKFEAPKIYTS